MVDTWTLSNNIESPFHDCEMKFWSLTIYNDTFCDQIFYQTMTLPVFLINDLIPELDLVPNCERFSWSICEGYSMLTGNAHSSGHTCSRRIWDLHMLYLLRQKLFQSIFFISYFKHPKVLFRFYFVSVVNEDVAFRNPLSTYKSIEMHENVPKWLVCKQNKITRDVRNSTSEHTTRLRDTGLTIRTNASPKLDRTRCTEQ